MQATEMKTRQGHPDNLEEMYHSLHSLQYTTPGSGTHVFPKESSQSSSPTQSLIRAQRALDHAISQQVKIRTILATCKTSGGQYLIQVGFNEDLIYLGKGFLQ